MGPNPTIKSDPKSIATRAGLLVGCALVFLVSACGTARAKDDSPSVKKSVAVAPGKAPSRRPAGPAKPTPAVSAPAAAPAAAKPSRPVEAKKPVEDKKSAASAEPDLPTRFGGQVFCPIPSEVSPNEELIVRCAVKAGLGVHSVIVRYRVSGKEEYSTIDAVRSPKGWFVTKIKGSEIRGGSIQLYVEAYSPGNRVVGTSGSDDNPNVILIHSGGSGGPSTDEDPLVKIQREQEEERMQVVEGRRRPSPSLWFGMGIGSGMGWYPSRNLERYSGGKATGWATGGLFHLLPEIGYNWTPHIAFSLQGRWQFVKTETQGGSTQTKPPHSQALAVLGCVYFMTDSRTSDWQIFGTAAVGAGTAFRLYVAPKRSRDPSQDFPNSDTVNGGPVVAGAGGGLIYHLTNYVALVGHVRSLAGFPKSAMIIEGGIGAQLALWPFSAYQSKKGPAVPQDLEPEPEYAPSEPVE